MASEPIRTLSDASLQRIGDVVRTVEQSPLVRQSRPKPGRGSQARVIRWARTTTSQDYPDYPDAGPVYVVEFGDCVASPSPVPGATSSQSFTAYDPEWKEIAVDPSGGTWDEGSIVRVERHDDGQWWIRPAGTSVPFVYLTDPGRLLNSGSGSPGTMQISAARWGAVYFKKSYNDPAAAGIEVLTEDAASVSDPAIRFTQDGFYRVSIRWTGQDESSYVATDYRYSNTIGSNTYNFVDQFHHAFPRCFVNFNEETGDGWPEIITSVSGSPENFGGYTNYGGGDPPTSSLTQMHWGESSRQASGFFYRNFTAGNELRFSMTYYKASGIVSTAVLFKINSFDVEIARIGDQVTEATYTL